MAMHTTQILNTERYPSIQPEHESGRALRSTCQQQLRENQYCVIPDFIHAEALSIMRDEAQKLQTLAYHNNALRNCYLHREQDPDLAADHPRNLQDRSSVRMIAYDQLDETSPLKRFYQSEAVRSLIADIVQEGPLFLSADAYQPANYVCYQDGDESAWHFDEDNSFTVTLMIQPAADGGQFEISPNTRSQDQENYPRVKKLLLGQANDSITSVAREAGALCIFRGCNSLHRVAPVHGEQLRIMGVFVYESAPDIRGDDAVNRTIYGPRIELSQSQETAHG